MNYTWVPFINHTSGKEPIYWDLMCDNYRQAWIRICTGDVSIRGEEEFSPPKELTDDMDALKRYVETLVRMRGPA